MRFIVEGGGGIFSQQYSDVCVHNFGMKGMEPFSPSGFQMCEVITFKFGTSLNMGKTLFNASYLIMCRTAVDGHIPCKTYKMII